MTDKTTGVHLSGPNNSTPFTDCCGVAVINEARCPRCGAEVLPRNPRERFRAAFHRQPLRYSNSPYYNDGGMYNHNEWED